MTSTSPSDQWGDAPTALAITVPSTDKRGASNSRVSFVRDLAPPLPRFASPPPPLPPPHSYFTVEFIPPSPDVSSTRERYPPSRPLPSPLSLSLSGRCTLFSTGYSRTFDLNFRSELSSTNSPATDFLRGNFQERKWVSAKGRSTRGQEFVNGIKDERVFCLASQPLLVSCRSSRRDVFRNDADRAAFDVHDEAKEMGRSVVENARAGGGVGRIKLSDFIRVALVARLASGRWISARSGEISRVTRFNEQERPPLPTD